MKIAYCIDKESLGGGCEYIRRKRDEGREGVDETEVFYSEKGECRARVIDAWGADEIVVNHLKALLQLLGRPWERPRGRVRMVVHGIHLRKYEWMRDESEGWEVRLKARLFFWMRRMLEAWLYRRCDEIVALTESDRKDILRLYGKNLKVIVEPNTLEGWTPYLAEPLDLWTRLSQSRQGDEPNPLTRLEQTRPRYVLIGRFDYQKGQDRWIRFLAAQRSTLNPQPSTAIARTLFIGDGEMLESCRKFVVDLGVADQCVFAGAIPEADRYLKCAEIVVSPSRWEGMPYLMMKARKLGCKILATDCPGNRDVLAGYDKWEKLEL